MKELIPFFIIMTLLVSIVLAVPNHKMSRIIAHTNSPVDRIFFKLQNCMILHELDDATAMECPEELIPRLKNVETDEIFHIMDLEADQQINADDVWSLGYTGSEIIIAVLDTGIDTDNPELVDSIAGCQGFGYATCEDDHGHGTHVSGIITANGLDANAKGVAPNAKVWMAKVCDSSGSCYSSDIVAAIEYVVNNHIAGIMSISLGGGGTWWFSCNRDYLASKVNWAVSNGVTVVAAAGNTAGRVSSPGCASRAIAVGAVDKNDVRASWSGSGYALDIMAPGVNIYSTLPDTYGYMSGTSMATPHVSAVAALMRQKNPSITDSEIKYALYKTAKDMGLPGWDIYYGWGRVDALAAVNFVNPPITTTSTTTTTTVSTTSTTTTSTTSSSTTSITTTSSVPTTSTTIPSTTTTTTTTTTTIMNITTTIPPTTTTPITTTTIPPTTTTIPTTTKCWNGDYQYLRWNGNQMGKFCKCAEGIYGYRSYSYSWGRKTVYYYLDSGDNENWDVSSRSSYLSIYRVVCIDGQAYPTNQDYHYS